MTDDSRERLGLGIVLCGLVASIAIRQGFWGYPIQLLLVGAALLGYSIVGRISVSPIMLWLGLAWIANGILVAFIGGSQQVFLSASEAITIDMALLLGVAGAALADKPTNRNLIKNVLFGVATISFFSVWLFSDSASIEAGNLWRLHGRQLQFLGSTEAVELGAIALALLYVLKLNNDRRISLFAAAVAALGVGAGFWLGARGGTIANLILVVVFTVQFVSKRLLYLVGVLVFAAAGHEIATGYGAFTQRKEVAQAVSAAFTSQPWGYGRGGFDRAIEPVASASLDFQVYESGARFAAPNDFFVGVAIERGFLGIGILAVAIILALLHLAKQRPLAHASWIALFFVAFLSFFSDLSYIPGAWWMVGMVIGAVFPATRSIVLPVWARGGLAILLAVSLLGVLHQVGSERELSRASEAIARDWTAESDRRLSNYALRSPDHAWGWLKLSRLRAERGQFDNAAEAAEKALLAVPTSPMAATLHTMVSVKTADFRRTVRHIDVWLDSPGYVPEDTYFVAAYALARLKNNERGIKVALKGLSQYPGNIELRRVLARLYMVEGRWPAAKHEWETIMQSGAANVQDVTYYEVALENMGLLESYTEILKNAYESAAPILSPPSSP